MVTADYVIQTSVKSDANHKLSTICVITTQHEARSCSVLSPDVSGHLHCFHSNISWKETQGIQNIGIKDSQGNRITDQKQVLKIWENYITELYDRSNRPEYLESELEEADL